MASVAKWYGQALLGQYGATASRRVDWANDTIKIALVKAAYTPDQDAHDFWNDVSANEAAGTNYTAGGKELFEKAVSYDSATNTLRMKAKTVEWKEVTVEYRYGVIYKEFGTSAESPLLGFIDTGATQKIAAGLVKAEWDPTDGTFRIVAA